jgi:hypothetical protein
MNQVPVDCYLYTERTKEKYSYALIVQKMKWLQDKLTIYLSITFYILVFCVLF